MYLGSPISGLTVIGFDDMAIGLSKVHIRPSLHVTALELQSVPAIFVRWSLRFCSPVALKLT